MFMGTPAAAQGIGIDAGAASDSLGHAGAVSDRWRYTNLRGLRLTGGIPKGAKL
jgi:hypothetical protein